MKLNIASVGFFPSKFCVCAYLSACPYMMYVLLGFDVKWILYSESISENLGSLSKVTRPPEL